MFGLLESSRSLGEPLAILYVRYGVGAQDFHAFTDSEQPITLAGVTYNPITVKIGSIDSSGTLDKKQLEVRTPMNNPLVELFRTYPPNNVVTLKIAQGHRDDPESEFITTWVGRILSFGFEGPEAKFTCEPAGTSLRRPGLRRTYSYGCQRVLYGPTCRADKTAATVLTTVSLVTGSAIRLAPDWFGSFDALKFQRGTLEWTTPAGSTVTRTILTVSDDNGTSRGLVLAGVPTALAAGMTVKVVLGCNHKAGIAAQPDGDCGPLHNNIPNFGGCPWIPTANPIGSKNNFY